MRVLPRTRLCLLAILITTTLFSCKDEKEEFSTDALVDYMPLAVGKYITLPGGLNGIYRFWKNY